MGEFELKFSFNNFQAPLLENWLDFQCRKDGDFTISMVVSIYFECIRGSAYAEKINSDYLKTKFRVRWYEDPATKYQRTDSVAPVFIEQKMKYGSQRSKARRSLEMDLRTIKSHDLSSPYHQVWKSFFFESGTNINLEPYLQVSYIRKRFVESLNGVRISLDTNIRVERSNQLYLPPPIQSELPVGVLEIKGNSAEVPRSLGYLTKTLARKTSFSKFDGALRC